MFVVLIHYDRPAEEVARVRPAHREFLQRYYASGHLVCSGPQVGGHGGVALARGADRAEVEAIFAQDPYRLQGVAHHELIEFQVVSHAPELAPFLAPR
ncbi:MAG TPA: YciI family protein [Polyangia bacterium]|jgi:uncharacterized protein YciI